MGSPAVYSISRPLRHSRKGVYRMSLFRTMLNVACLYFILTLAYIVIFHRYGLLPFAAIGISILFSASVIYHQKSKTVSAPSNTLGKVNVLSAREQEVQAMVDSLPEAARILLRFVIRENWGQVTAVRLLAFAQKEGLNLYTTAEALRKAGFVRSTEEPQLQIDPLIYPALHKLTWGTTTDVIRPLLPSPKPIMRDRQR